MISQLVETHDYLPNSPIYSQLDQLCFLSKNLYNATLYAVRQHYFAEKKYLSYNTVCKEFSTINQLDYRALPAKVSQATMKMVDQNFKSFFVLLKKKNTGDYNKAIKIPRYLPKLGRYVVHYTNQAISTVKKPGYVNLSKNNIFIKTKVTNIQFVRIVPKRYKITVEIGYQVNTPDYCTNYKNYAAIDLGINNLATVTFATSLPYIINGRPLKSINQFYNKIHSQRRSRQERNGKNTTTKKMLILERKRDNQIKNYLHKASRFIVNQLVSQSITDLVIGYNQGWKQGTKLGKRTNQHFVSIPFGRFVQMIQYKCQLVGIVVHLIDESYTSKASYLDRDYIPTYGDTNIPVFSGKRVKRGLYKASRGMLINADINGSLNIIRKYLQEQQQVITFSNDVTSNPKVYTIG